MLHDRNVRKISMKRLVRSYLLKWPYLFEGIVRLNRWFLQLIHVIRHPWAHTKHHLSFKMLAGPGFLGFQGGVFNPGSVITADQKILLLAKGQVRHLLTDL